MPLPVNKEDAFLQLSGTQISSLSLGLCYDDLSLKACWQIALHCGSIVDDSKGQNRTALSIFGDFLPEYVHCFEFIVCSSAGPSGIVILFLLA